MGGKKSNTSEVVPQTHPAFKYSLLVLDQEMPRKSLKKEGVTGWDGTRRDVFNSKQERGTHPTDFLYLFFREKYLHEALVVLLHQLASV